MLSSRFLPQTQSASISIKRLMSTAEKVRSTASSGSQVYESKRAVTEYLLFHYGSNDNVLIRHNNSPDRALNFLKQSAELCSRYIPVKEGSSIRGRALDIGCAVGGTSFELTTYFNEVVGIDYSNHFVDAANMMKERGEAEIDILKQGTIFTKANVKVSDRLDRCKASFYQGDACNLDPQLGLFDAVVASNLLCRLPSPRKFLADIPSFIKPGGVLVLISPYSWLEEYTAKEEWIGGSQESGGDSAEAVAEILSQKSKLELIHREDIPFMIREHERKYQYGVSDCTIWRKSI